MPHIHIPADCLRVVPIKGKPNLYIRGTIPTPNGTQDVKFSARTTDPDKAQLVLEQFLRAKERDLEAAEKMQVLADAGVDTGRLTVTVADAARLYVDDRHRNGKPFKRIAEARNLDRFVDRFGDMSIYSITPDRALLMVQEFMPDPKPQTRKRYGTALISALYSAAARHHTGFEARQYKHEKSVVKRRPAADQNWISEFMQLADRWSPDTRPFQVRRTHYDLDVTTWRMLVKTCVMFLFTTASRIGETALIEWQHVDLQNQSIFIPGENRKNGLGTTKMLTREMVAAFQTLGAHIPSGHGLPLFPYIANTSPARCFNKRIVQVCGDRLEHLTSHEIGSHGCISMLIEAGFTEREISEITGKAMQTIKLYGQSSARAKLSAVQSVFGDSEPKRDRKETDRRQKETENSRPMATYGRL